MKKTLTLQAANGLFLLSIALLLTIGSVMQVMSLTLGLIGTEFLLILLPAALLLRKRGISLREGLRLRGMPVKWALACAALGVFTYLFTIWIEAQMLMISGLPPVALPEGSMPQGPVQLTLYFVALAIAAPICEEALFRGAIQGAYENHRGPKVAIITVGLMFAFYHFRLTGLPALLPVAFMLGYVVWRSQSLLAGVLLHAGMNASSALYTIVTIARSEAPFSLVTPWLNLIGLVGAVGLLLLIARCMPKAEASGLAAPQMEASRAADAEVVATAEPRRGWFANYWPLVVAFPIYLLVAGLSLLPLLYPELTAQKGVKFTAPEAGQAEVEQRSRYTIINRAGDAVGSATCSTARLGERIRLECRSENRAYEVQTQTGFFADGDNIREWSAEWDAQTLALVAYESKTTPKGGESWAVALRDGELVSTHRQGSASAPLPEGSLVELEWPWRAGYLSLQSGVSYMVPFGWQSRWDDAAKTSLPGSKESLLRMAPLEMVTVPAGAFQTWKVSIGDESAWLEGSPARVVQYDDGMVTYRLEE